MQRSYTQAAGLLGMSILLAACGSGGKSADGGTTPPVSAQYAATVRYTSYGVPHVLAKDFKGAGYGYGYAFAQDQLCSFAEEAMTLRGHRAQYLGAQDAQGQPIGYYSDLGEAFIDNFSSDLFYRLTNTAERRAAIKAASSSDLQALVHGFVVGYNRYLRENSGDKLPQECRNAGWMTPISEDDIYGRLLKIGLVGSSANFISEIANSQPPGASSAVQGRPAVKSASGLPTGARLLQVRREQSRNRVGSNALALGSETHLNGGGLLFGNPHFPWQGSLRMHQLHLTVGNQYDVQGAALLGVPLPVIGFNRDLAWSHAFNKDVRFTLQSLKLDPADPTRYLVDGQSRAMTQHPITVSAKQPDGSQKSVSRTLYSTHYGPIFSDLGLGWSRQQAYAVQDVNLDNLKVLEQFFANSKAHNVAELQQALTSHGALPWVHTVAADRQGKTLYANYARAVNVSDSLLQRCVRGDLANALLEAGVVMLDGSDSQCSWQGALPMAQRPLLQRNDYVQNANDSHWLSNPQQPLTGYPLVLGLGDEAEGRLPGERTVAGLTMVADRMLGRDGLSGVGFTQANLQQLVQSGRVHHAEAWLDGFVSDCLANPSVGSSEGTLDLTEACKVLQGWNKRHQLDSAGAVLFEQLYMALGSLRDDDYWQTPFNPAKPLETPRGFRSGNVSAKLTLAEVVRGFAARGISLNASPRMVNTLQHGSEQLALPGGAETYFNLARIERGGRVDWFGNSYMQLVSFDSQGPVAEGLLTYSQSSHAASPHRLDQTRLYSAGKWAKLPFTEAQIKADPAYRVVELSE